MTPRGNALLVTDDSHGMRAATRAKRSALHSSHSKTHTTMPLLLLVLVLLIATTVADSSNPRMQQHRPMAGGYAAVPDLQNDERLLNAANFAVSTLLSDAPTEFTFVSKLPPDRNDYSITVARGFQQVVAGMNYKMVIVLTSKSDADSILGAFGVTVYDRFGELSVTKWGKEVPNEEAKAMLENRHEFAKETPTDATDKVFEK